MKAKKVVVQKVWWKSKTNWVALITIALGILGLLETFMQQIDSKYLYIIILVIGVLGLVLRQLTGLPVGMTEVVDIVKKAKKAKAASEENEAPEPPKAAVKVKVPVVDLEEKMPEEEETDGDEEGEEPHALGDILDKGKEEEKDDLDAMMDDIEKKIIKK